MKNIACYILLSLLALITNPSFSQDFWEIVNSPSDASPAYINISADNVFNLGSNNGVYISYDSCTSWQNLGLSDMAVISVLPFQNIIFAGVMSIGSGIYKYNNGFWTKVLTSDNILILFSDTDNNLFAGTWGGIFKSLDFGENWIQTLTITTTAAVFSIVEDHDGILYAGATNYMGGEGAFRSLDHGDTWEYFGLHNVYVSSLAVNSINELFAGAQGHQLLNLTGAGVYKYDKDQQEWIQIKDSLIVSTMVINSEDEIYIGRSNDFGGQGCVLVSYDDGYNWQLLDSGLGTDNMKQLTLTPDEHIYTISGFSSNTIHRSVNSRVGISPEIKVQQPVTYNYPNPFSGKTYIYYPMQMNSSGQIYLNVFDLNGDIVRSKKIIQNSLSNNRILFNSTGLTPGVYLYEIISDNYKCSGKMIIK